MNEDDIVDGLTRFGLSDKEALAYLTILRNGTTRISVVSEEANLSKSYTYDVADRLEAKSLIAIDDHVVPTQIRALPPSQGIENLVSQLYTMEAELESIFDSESYEEETFSVIKSRQTIIRKVTELVDSAETEVVLSLPAAAVPAVTDVLQAAHETGTFCLLLVTEYDGETTVDDGLAHVVQTWDAPAPVILTTDRTDGLVGAADAILDSNSSEYAIYHADAHIAAALFDSFIANYWPMGSEAHVATASGLPEAYDGFRRAIFDAALHLAADRSLEAEVAVRPARTTAAVETLTGPVVDVNQSLVRPYANGFPTQESLLVAPGDETISVGGPRAFVEEYEATDVTLSAGDDS
ncbi:TrmB family transcriptional regulator [Halobacteria archaeon HArc-gm2]|nr:TrmB family transcriptional regulator [Halobacteria archaeon HArc-gm2]